MTVEMHSVHVVRFYPHLHVRKVALIKLNAKNISKEKGHVKISCHSYYETNVDVFCTHAETSNVCFRLHSKLVYILS